MTAWARRQAGRDPRRVLPVRRGAAYAGGKPVRVAANDNAVPVPAPARPRRGAWLLSFAFAGLTALALALA